MAKNNPTLKKVLLGFVALVSSIGVIAIGVKLGNVGYKQTIDDLKDAIKETLDKDKNSTTPSDDTKTSTQAVKIEYVNYVA